MMLLLLLLVMLYVNDDNAKLTTWSITRLKTSSLCSQLLPSFKPAHPAAAIQIHSWLLSNSVCSSLCLHSSLPISSSIGEVWVHVHWCDTGDLLRIALSMKSQIGRLTPLYGLFKQATHGPCDVPRPAFYDVTGRSKWYCTNGRHCTWDWFWDGVLWLWVVHTHFKVGDIYWRRLLTIDTGFKVGRWVLCGLLTLRFQVGRGVLCGL